MEYIKKTLFINVNTAFFGLCFALPVLAFFIAILLISAFSDSSGGSGLTYRGLGEFVNYYDENFMGEFLQIFLNNYSAALVMVFFTPAVLSLRRLWERWRRRTTELSAFEKILLYLFPGLFLIRQAINIAVILNSFASSINKNVMIAFVGIILPHGLPELLAFSLAGAIGMEVTRKILLSYSSVRLVNIKILAVLTASVALCAFLEVYFTPKIFALLMSMVGIG